MEVRAVPLSVVPQVGNLRDRNHHVIVAFKDPKKIKFKGFISRRVSDPFRILKSCSSENNRS